MTAFNTATESPSVSFTDSYGTAIFQEAGSDQYVYGFARNNNNTSGQRYFEFHVVNVGGDPGKVYLGFGDDIGAYDSPSTPPDYSQLKGQLWNGPQYTILAHPSLTTSLPSYWSATTLTTSDVYMFWVDWSANNTTHTLDPSGTYVTSGSVGSVSESRLYGMTVLLGKNGVWGGASAALFKAPFLGKYGWIAPLAVRGATSASAASVSLKVVTTSFAYPIPTGAVAWGDGPQGTPATVTDYQITWDPNLVSTYGSLTDGNCVALQGATGGGTSWGWVMSTALPTVGSGAGLRVYEFYWGTVAPYFTGLIDADTVAGPTGNFNPVSGSISSSDFYWFEGADFRKAEYASLTAVGQLGKAVGGHTMQIVIDHDNQRFWEAGNWVGYSAEALWMSTIGTGSGSPYKAGGTNGITLTDSIGLRFAVSQFDNQSLSYVEINAGRKPFFAYPLMPGVISGDGTRRVMGQGDTWRTLSYASLSYSHGYLGFRSAKDSSPEVRLIDGSSYKNSGKYFYQIFHGQGAPTWTGLREQSVGTFSNINNAAQIVWSPTVTNQKIVRYGVTTTATMSPSASLGAGFMWTSAAVDFDAGKIWFGTVSPRYRTNVWLNGGDPAAGTGEAATFTAGTALRFMTTQNVSVVNRTTIFVGDDNNVIDPPTGFSTWNGSGQVTSTTATPSGGGGGGVLWPYGVQT